MAYEKDIQTYITSLTKTLNNGKNTLTAIVRYKGKEYKDEIKWNYTGEKKREADSYVNKSVHAGW